MEEIEPLILNWLQTSTSEDREMLKLLLKNSGSTQLFKGESHLIRLFQMERQIEDESVIMTMPITPLVLNSLGLMHGGISSFLMDSAMGTLANIKVSSDKKVVTTDMNVHFIKIPTGDQLIAKASIIHQGRQTMVLESFITDNVGNKIATSTARFIIINTKN